MKKVSLIIIYACITLFLLLIVIATFIMNENLKDYTYTQIQTNEAINGVSTSLEDIKQLFYELNK